MTHEELMHEVAAAQAEMQTWTPERRANVQLEGRDVWLELVQKEQHETTYKRL